MRGDSVVVAGNPGLELTILPELGARIHRLRVLGHDLLRSPDQIELHRDDPFFWGAFVMAPWCGRIVPGATALAGSVIDVPVNFPDGTAIHGQVYDAAWTQTSVASFEIERGGTSQWPWRYQVSIGYEIDGLTLRVGLRLTNLDVTAMPGGIGLHPWFVVPLEMMIDAGLAYPSNSAPPARPNPVGGALDRRRRGELAAGVDATWTEPGPTPVELWWPRARLHAVLAAPGATHIVAASFARLGAVAVEPQTHAPQGVRRLLRGEPGALELIEPGRGLELAIQLTFEEVAAN